MSKIKLKAIVSEIIKEMVDTHPVHKNINDKLMQIAKRGFDAEEDEKYVGDADKGNKILDKANPDNVAAILRGEKPMKEGEEKEYTVDYWYRYGKDGDDKEMDDITVKASSEAEALEKAKQQARRGAMSSSFEIRKRK
jgi:LmbE family N-acetylglucosaminyl deacetylase